MKPLCFCQGDSPHRTVLLEIAGSTVHTRNTAHGTALHYCLQSSQQVQTPPCSAHKRHWQGHWPYCYEKKDRKVRLSFLNLKPNNMCFVWGDQQME